MRVCRRRGDPGSFRTEIFFFHKTLASFNSMHLVNLNVPRAAIREPLHFAQLVNTSFVSCNGVENGL